jgi:pimeloyl-ACP methyl ester carboxylesterase
MTLIPKRTGTFKSFDDTEIYYEIRGEGRPVILNYGIGCLINHWNPQIRHFSQTNQVITYDYRAHHNSAIPKDLRQMNMEALAKDLQGLMSHLQISKASLWGHSFGAQMLMRTYEMFPELFDNVIFVNGFVRNPLSGMFGTDWAYRFFKGFKSGFDQLPQTFSSLWKTTIRNPLSVPISALAGGFNLKLTSVKDIEIYTRGISSMDLNAFLTLFEAMTEYDGFPVLSKIKVPTLIIAGKKDAITPVKLQREMHNAVPGSQFLIVPYGTHCTQLDMADLVNQRIAKFLKAH